MQKISMTFLLTFLFLMLIRAVIMMELHILFLPINGSFRVLLQPLQPNEQLAETAMNKEFQ
ncbi:MAG: hypothetical protein JWQ40_653 [Segetibacter sp.]|jgi:hypothetical protein|nr:hypothetical protein [Segetibacter sp.]